MKMTKKGSEADFDFRLFINRNFFYFVAHFRFMLSLTLVMKLIFKS